ncbi:MAG: DUF2442 domain-containing protein [Rhodothermales bacterium]|nr:DUF2442 domain-containing protein [Rhodothermales bacterium]
MHKIVSAIPQENCRLRLRFDSGEDGVVDLSDLAGRGVFEMWREEGVFEAVEVTSAGALRWGTDIDLCPDAMYLRMTGKSPEDEFESLRSGVNA